MKISYAVTMMELQRQARERGDMTFLAGVPCRHGHNCPRYTCSRQCVECRAAIVERDAPKQKATAQRWWARNREKELARQKKYRQDNGAAIARYAKEYREANKRTVREGVYRWRRENPTVLRANWSRGNARRRARMQGSTSRQTPAYRAFSQWARREPRIKCYWCGVSTKPKARHVDHVVPLAQGGADAVGNLCVACPSCNCSKGPKLPFDFAGQGEMSFQ